MITHITHLSKDTFQSYGYIIEQNGVRPQNFQPENDELDGTLQVVVQKQ